jgi:hypothetical protein
LFSLASFLQNSSSKPGVAAKQRRKRLFVSVYHRPITLLFLVPALISPKFAEFSPDLLTAAFTLETHGEDGEVGETGERERRLVSARRWSINQPFPGEMIQKNLICIFSSSNLPSPRRFVTAAALMTFSNSDLANIDLCFYSATARVSVVCCKIG